MRFKLYDFKCSGCFGMVTTAAVNLIQEIFYWQCLWTHWSGITLLHHPLRFGLGSHYLKKPRRSCVTIKKIQKKDPKSYFLTWWPPDMLLGQNFLHYCILLFITFDLICHMTMFVQNGFWTLLGHTPLALPPEVKSKFWMCSSTPYP